MFTKIVLCSDGSEQALQAARAAAEITRRFQSDLTLLSVFNPAALLASFALAPEVAPQTDVVTECGEELHASVREKTGAVLDEKGAPYTFRSEMGHPVDAIVSTAQSCAADLIVLGSRGLSEWKALLLGSVSEGVLHHAPCPVLIVRGEQTVFSKVLLASDGSAGAYQATCAAGALARKFAAPLTILNVVEPPGPLAHALQGDAEWEASVMRAREIVSKRIRDMAEQADCSYTICHEIGHPVETIVQYAKQNNYPLIVLGSRGIGALRSLALGSVSHRVAHHAHGSVLVVR